jgi:hypothetical protein
MPLSSGVDCGMSIKEEMTLLNTPKDIRASGLSAGHN